MSKIRRKVFISYHHEDQEEVNQFVKTFDDERDVFISRGLGLGMADDIVKSSDTDYVMRRIRELYYNGPKILDTKKGDVKVGI